MEPGRPSGTSGTLSRRGWKTMADSKIKDTNYFMVSGWMINRLNLKGVALQVFSIIHGFSQDGESSFTGSLQYLVDFTNSSKNTVLKALKELVDLGYIQKAESTINGVKFCTYKIAPVVQKLNQGGAEIAPGGSSETAPGGGAETEPNKEDINNKYYISKNIPTEIMEVMNAFHEICKSFPRVRKITPDRQKMVKERLSVYTLEEIKTVFQNAERSDFLKGRNDRKWKADFDWLLGEKNIVKVLEDKYTDGRKEMVPEWMGRKQVEDEIAAMDRLLNVDLLDRAEQLKKELQGG
jgi:hypothetical protein